MYILWCVCKYTHKQRQISTDKYTHLFLPALDQRINGKIQLWAKDTPLEEVGDGELRELSSSGMDSIADNDL